MKIPRFKINIPKISIPGMPKFRLPAFKLPKFKWWTRFLNKTKTAFNFILPYAIGIGNGILYTLTFLTVVTGALLLTITLANPVNLWWSMSPIETPYFVIGYSQVITYIEFIQSYYWESVGTGVGLILFGYVIHIRSIKALYEGIKASPSAVFYSPITFYKALKDFRDWLFEKIEYLNGESETWRRFFTVMKSPYSLLRSLGLNPQMAIAVLGIGSTTAVGVGVAEVMEVRSFSNQSPGIYMAPSEYPNEELEKTMAWRKDNPGDSTLRVVLSTVDVEKIDISGINLGTSYASNGQASALPSGATSVLNISGNNTRIEVGKLIFSRNSCKSLDLFDINANKVTIKDNQADGLSIYQSFTSTQPNIRHSSGNFSADLLETTGGTYDMLVIMPEDSMTSTKARVNELNLTNIVSSGAGSSYACVLNKLDVGELEITFGRIGGDNSLVTKAFSVSSTVRAASWAVDDNIEVLMGEVDRQPD